jgi:chemotaxis protein methyltransferase CheR
MLVISHEDFLRLARFIQDSYGIDLSKKKQLIEGRLRMPFLSSGCATFGEYLDQVLSGDQQEIFQLLNRLTTNHTYFMRESAHFDLFKNTILPRLERIKKDRVLSIWSAGCSTGQEPYTLSMILMDYFGSKSSQWDTRLLATDISQRALDAAKAATYEAQSLAGIPEHWKKKYFEKNNESFTLTSQIRDNVIFRSFNLMEPIRFKLKFDVIFCRNVMIYFDTPTRQALVHRFYDATAPGGYLLVGHSETLGTINHPYVPIGMAAYIKPSGAPPNHGR